MVAGSDPVAPYDSLQREKAYSYLDGARDTSEGRIWCDVNQLKTPDLADELANQIKKLPVAERKKNASVLILGLLGRDFPEDGARLAAQLCEPRGSEVGCGQLHRRLLQLRAPALSIGQSAAQRL